VWKIEPCGSDFSNFFENAHAAPYFERLTLKTAHYSNFNIILQQLPEVLH
jgi:hypothetical protein